MSVGLILFLRLEKRLKAIIVLVLLSLFSGLRYGIGTDYFSYQKRFFLAPFHNLLHDPLEMGHWLLNKLVAVFFSDAVAMILVYAFLTSFFTVIALFLLSKRISFSFEMSLICYITLGFYFSSFNITAQALAQSIILLAYCSIAYNRKILGLVTILIASTIHVSALIVLPFVFLLKFKNRAFFPLVTAFGLTSLIFFEEVAVLVGRFGGVYSIYYATKYTDEGANLLNLVPSFTIIVGILVFSRSFFNEKNPISEFARLLFIGFIFTGMASFGMGFARIASYFWMSSIIVVPKLLESFSYEEKPLAFFAVTTTMLVYMLFYVSKYGDLIPYVSILNTWR